VVATEQKDPHQTTRATTNGDQAESEDRESVGYSSRTTSAHDREVCVETTAALRELNDRKFHRALSPVPWPVPAR